MCCFWNSVLKASNNSAPTYLSTIYCAHISKAGGVSKFLSGPSAGGGGGGGAAPGAYILFWNYCNQFLFGTFFKIKNVAAAAASKGGAPAASAAPEKPKEEEVDALDGGMDMFGGGGGGKGDY